MRRGTVGSGRSHYVVALLTIRLALSIVAVAERIRDVVPTNKHGISFFTVAEFKKSFSLSNTDVVDEFVLN